MLSENAQEIELKESDDFTDYGNLDFRGSEEGDQRVVNDIEQTEDSGFAIVDEEELE